MWNDLVSYADQLSIGDEVLVQGNNDLTSAKVINISDLTMQGKYCNLLVVTHCALLHIPFLFNDVLSLQNMADVFIVFSE